MTNPLFESQPSDSESHQSYPAYQPPGQATPPGYGTASGYETPAPYGMPGSETPAYGAPQTGYGYGPPPAGYGAAPPAYGVPPQPDYGMPQPGYGMPQPGYGMPQPYAYPSPYMPARQHEGLAIASLAVSCAAVFGLCTSGIAGVLGIVGAILGHVARSRIKRNGRAGAGLALAGIIVGWVLAVISAAIVVGLIFLVVHDKNTYGGTPI